MTRANTNSLPSSQTVADNPHEHTSTPVEVCAPGQRAPWVRPRLEMFGDVRQLTMGGTLGINESGNPARFP